MHLQLPFDDRQAAGRALAQRLADRFAPGPASPPGPPRLVLALPRGGVPVAAEVARALHAPLDLLLVRKLGAPGQPELAVGAAVEGVPEPEVVLDDRMCALTGADGNHIAGEVRRATVEIERRRQLYRHGIGAPAVAGATVIVVDDGIATGATMRAALQALRRGRPARLLLAVPVAPASALQALRGEVDEIVCLFQPEPFVAVGAHYRDFHQVADDEVMATVAAVSTLSALSGIKDERLASRQTPARGPA